MEYYNYYDFFVAFLIPLTLIITLNTVTACAVWRPNKLGRNIKDNNRYVSCLNRIYGYIRKLAFRWSIRRKTAHSLCTSSWWLMQRKSSCSHTLLPRCWFENCNFFIFRITRWQISKLLLCSIDGKKIIAIRC